MDQSGGRHGIALVCDDLHDFGIILDATGLDERIEKAFENVVEVTGAAVRWIILNHDFDRPANHPLPTLLEPHFYGIVIFPALFGNDRIRKTFDKPPVTVFTHSYRKFKFNFRNHFFAQGGAAGVAGTEGEVPAAGVVA